MKLSELRVSIFTEFYPPDYAATGQLIEELAIELSKLGIRVKVFTGQPGYAFQKACAPALEISDKLTIQRSRTSRLWHSRIRGKGVNGLLFFVRSALHLIRASRRGDVLLLTTAPPFLPILGYLNYICFGTPYVCLLYDLYPDIAVELKVIAEKHKLVKIWNWFNKKAWSNAARVIVLNSTMQQKVQSKCPQTQGKVSVVHNWANPDWIIPIEKQDNHFAKEHGLVDLFTVLYSGNMGRCHEMDTILGAAKYLQSEPIQFIFIGDGAKKQKCIDTARDLGLNNCKFLPYQEKHTLPYSLTACDLSLVSISDGMEGLVVPSKVYGMLASSRPIAAICQNDSYLRTLIDDAKCGAAFDIGDSIGLAKFICWLARDGEMAKRMGIAGRSYLISHFTPQIIAKEYSQILYQAAFRNYRTSKSTQHQALP